jgi:isopenicillin-N epimerase
MQSYISKTTIQPKHFAKYWSLDPEIVYLNHGSFGACPRTVLETQLYLRQQMERNPMVFFVEELESLWEKAIDVLANFINADRDELVFIPNATTGVNTILRSLSFAPGDEILITNHEYNACRNVAEFVADRAGASVVIANIPFPIESPEQIIEAVLAKVTPKTKLALLDHVTSQTGLIFPIQQLVRELNNRGIDTLVDGAHAAGMIPLNLREIGAAYYTGNCHKWMCAPKGAAFLCVRGDRQKFIRPLVISHGANSSRQDKSRFHLEFNWTGTDDPTAYLCVPEAIRLMGALLPGGWLELTQRNNSLIQQARQIVCQSLDIPLPCPDEMLGNLASIPLPTNFLKLFPASNYIDPLQAKLKEQFAIEVPVISWGLPSLKLLRISAQIYNTTEQYQYLADRLQDLCNNSKKISEN